mgnify:CR=1 FL=1
MDSNLNLTLGFKGQVQPKAQAVPLQEGYIKLGGLVDAENQSAGLPFGVVVSAPSANPQAIVAGKGTGNVVRGICVYDDAIAMNAPAHPDRYLAGTPCAFVAKGLVRFDSWDAEADGASAPAIGSKVQYNDTTGVVSFVASTAGTGSTLLGGAEVIEVTETSVYVWLG